MIKPTRVNVLLWITSSFIYTSSINRIVTLSLSLDSIISLLCQPKQHWRRPLLQQGGKKIQPAVTFQTKKLHESWQRACEGDPLPATNPHIETLCFRVVVSSKRHQHTRIRLHMTSIVHNKMLTNHQVVIVKDDYFDRMMPSFFTCFLLIRSSLLLLTSF
ncbi:hypothetical protein IGI04_021249 [Brassica rapa subsp. trilocularis]|nr:hypothetical protein IGI04_021249 [Brassica rapa subsp. trilocularis]